MMTEGQQVVHQSVEHLYGPQEVPYEKDELIVVCLVRDGRPYVCSFVEHYSALGAKHLVFLDNGSTDGTTEALKAYDNVTVLRSTLPFKEYDPLMKQYLVGCFGRKGRWCLYVDIDELFDYPYSDVVGLGSFLGYLRSKDYTAVVAQMLDMFPEEPLSGRGGGGSSGLQEEYEDVPLKELHRFYDLSNIKSINIKEHPLFRNNTLESDEIEFFRGGVRDTVFDAREISLTKLPLIFLDDRVQRMDDSSHWVDNARVADITCVLFHYKFLDGYLHEQALQAVREENHWNNSAQYRRYLEVLESASSLQVKQQSSRELEEGVNELLEEGFLVVSEDYLSWVNAQEEEQHQQRQQALLGDAAAAALGGEGDELAEAYLEFRRQQRAKTLRMQRLGQQLRQERRSTLLEARQNQRLRQRIERLKGNWQQARKAQRRLERIEASRIWKLVEATRIWKLLKALRSAKGRALSLAGSRRGSS